MNLARRHTPFPSPLAHHQADERLTDFERMTLSDSGVALIKKRCQQAWKHPRTDNNRMLCVANDIVVAPVCLPMCVRSTKFNNFGHQYSPSHSRTQREAAASSGQSSVPREVAWQSLVTAWVCAKRLQCLIPACPMQPCHPQSEYIVQGASLVVDWRGGKRVIRCSKFNVSGRGGKRL